jgi:hypothetical protein
MRSFRRWSFAKVLLVSGAWVLLCLAAGAAWLFLQFQGVLASAASSGSGGIGFVSMGFSGLVLAIPVVPAIILILAWLMAKGL